jgi:prevent-host-death family protein
MKTVNIAELKNQLSRYITEVKAGQEIVIRDRTLAVARLVPMADQTSPDDELHALASQGKIRLGEGALEASFWEMPAPRVPRAALQTVIQREREDG